MRERLVIGSEAVVKGDVYRINHRGASAGIGKYDQKVSIWGFKGVNHIGLESEVRIPEWGNLDGNVLPGYGKWVTPFALINHLVLMSTVTEYKINTEFLFKNKELKSMPCKILHHYADGNVFVEVYEDVGGCSCDGLGKAGHCVVLPCNKLTKQHR